MSCGKKNEPTAVGYTPKPVQLVTVDPGHFHAALVQKTVYPEVDSTVYVYAPEGNDLKLHLDRIREVRLLQIGMSRSIPDLIFLKK
jgi:hypothetical protein